MLAAAFTIRFEMPVDGRSIAKIRDFGEELLSRMREQSLGDVTSPDTAIDDLSVSISSPRHRGEVRRMIRKTLAKHRLDVDAVLTDV
jgi:hypothetical protein